MMPFALLFVSIVSGTLVLRRFFPFGSNLALQISFGWLIGQFMLGWLAFLLSSLLIPHSDLTLKETANISLIILTLGSIYAITRRIKSSKNIAEKNYSLAAEEICADAKSIPYAQIIALLLSILALFALSYQLYSRQLTYRDGAIYNNFIYWDLKWHAGLIQNFVYGNNFPVENESFAGAPQTYHFFWGFLQATYSALGWNLVESINYLSITAFFVLGIGIIGLAREFFQSWWPALLACVLALTHGSLRFIENVQNNPSTSPVDLFWSIILNNDRPDLVALPAGQPFGYNGNMFNLFYFVAERQMIIGILCLLFFMALVWRRKQLSSWSAVISGAALGLFFEWHLYITLIFPCGLLALLIFKKEKSSALILAGFLCTFIPYAIYYFLLTRDPRIFSPVIASFPCFNTGFAAIVPGTQANPIEMIFYYLYAYGLRLELIPIGYLLLWKKKKSLFWAFFCVLPAFLLTNSVQLSAASIYENHKWLRPANVAFDMLCAYSLWQLWKLPRVLYKLSAVFLFFISILSGLIELMPYMHAEPNQLYARTDSALISDIREKTPAKAIFLSPHQRELHLAGRKVFRGDYHAAYGMGLNIRDREESEKAIYAATTLPAFCQLVNENHIDYVETSRELPNESILGSLEENGFTAIHTVDDHGQAVTLLSSSNCKQVL